jgi:hypothetical protein
MVVKYIAVLTDNIEEEELFFMSVLKYKMVGKIELWAGVNCKLMKLNDNSFNIILIPELIELKGKSIVIISTDSCLRDYHLIKNTEVKFKSGPQYLANGLSVEFENKSGNRFILLEEREYEEI